VQAFLYNLLQGEEEATALRALAVLTELHRRNVWRDARTVNVIGEWAQLLCAAEQLLDCRDLWTGSARERALLRLLSAFQPPLS